ncbi:hypothetical protein LTR22_026632 [Elasticomyces elasticus]|nr:hypothetical protein LTR22_026632 [Elasticomyces elasticus]
MSDQAEFRAFKGWGELAKKELGYSQTVRIGNVIRISGQGAWDPTVTDISKVSMSDDVNEQTDQAFANVEVALKDAGGSGWSQVYSIRSLHVALDADHTAAMARNLKRYCPNNPPIWTEYGVAALGLPAMKVEIEVEALVQ